jgi:hypothetical protein
MASQFIKVIEDSEGKAIPPLYLTLADIVTIEHKAELDIWAVTLMHRTKPVFLKNGTRATENFLEALDRVTLNAD